MKTQQTKQGSAGLLRALRFSSHRCFGQRVKY